MEFGETVGVIMNPRILRSIIELLESDVSPASIIQVLNELAVFRFHEQKSRKMMRNTTADK